MKSQKSNCNCKRSKITINNNYSLDNLVSVDKKDACDESWQAVYDSRAFSVAAPTLWNSLPADITNAASLTAIGNSLKTFLFHHTPSCCSAD